MAQMSDQYLQLNDDGTPRRKHDIEEQAERRPFFYIFSSLVFISALSMMKNIWFGEDALRAHEPGRTGPRFGEPPQAGTISDGEEFSADAALSQPDRSEQAENAAEDLPATPGYLRGSGLKFSLSPLDLNFNDGGAISTAKLGPPLAPPVNDNIRLYGANPGAPIILPDELRGGGTGSGGVDGLSQFAPIDSEDSEPQDPSAGSGGGNSGAGSGTGSGASGNGGSSASGGGMDGTGGGAGSGTSGSGGASADPRQANRLPSVSNVVLLSTLMINEARSLEQSELLADASDADGDALQIANVKASVGHVVMTSTGGWLYVPQFNDTSVVELTYEISDGEGYVIQKAYLPMSAGPHAPLNGTDGDDTLMVGPIDDVMARIVDAGAGNDTVTTGAGDDIVYGGAGDDVIRTGAGDDVVFAGDGNDTVEAGIGNDIVYGEGGDDHLYGEAGNDKIYGGAGDDILDGGDGNDTLTGGADEDLITAGAGDDLIVSEEGDAADTVHAGSGDDTYIAASDDGDDHVSGDEGNDTFYAATGDGDDKIIGGTGNDTFVSAEADGVDHVQGLEGHDVYIAVSVGDGDTFDGGEGSDTFNASAIEAAIIVDLTAGTVTLIEANVDDPVIAAAAGPEPSEPALESEIAVTGDASVSTSAPDGTEMDVEQFAADPAVEPTTLTSVEHVIGGEGDDVFIANGEQNDLSGGEGDDTFVFETVASAGLGSGHRDRILDFDVGDRINIDSISDEFENQFNETFDDPGIRKFVVIGQAQEFSRPGEVRFKYDEDSNTTILDGNVDYDADTDFQVEIFGVHELRYDNYVYSA